MGGLQRESCLPPDRLPGEPPAGAGCGSMDAAVPCSPPPHPRPAGLGLHREEASGSALGLYQRSHRRGTPALPEAPPGCRAEPRSRGRLPRYGQALPRGAEAGAAEAPTSRREVAVTASGEASPCKFSPVGGRARRLPQQPLAAKGPAGLGPPGRCLSAFAAARNWSCRSLEAEQQRGMRRASPGCEGGSHRPVARAAPG